MRLDREFRQNLNQEYSLETLSTYVTRSISLAKKDWWDTNQVPVMSQFTPIGEHYDPLLIETVNSHLFQFASKQNVSIERGNVPNDNRGVWDPTKRRITLRNDLNRVNSIEVLAHEVAHVAAGHDQYCTDTRPEQEVMAFGASFLYLHAYGIDTHGMIAPNIAFYSFISREHELFFRKKDDIVALVELMMTE